MRGDSSAAEVPSAIVVSSNHEHHATVTTLRTITGQGYRVAHGDTSSPIYSRIGPVTVTDTGSVLFVARSAEGAVLYNSRSTTPIDGDLVPSAPVIASKLGDRVAIAFAKVRSGYFEVDGKRYGPYSDIKASQDSAEWIRFSQDGKHWGTFVKEAGSDWTLLIDGISRHQTYAEVVEVSFSPDGERAAYLTFEQDRSVSVHSGALAQENWSKLTVPGITRDGIIWSPNGKSVAFVASAPTIQYLVINGERQAQHAGIGTAKQIFSSDGRRHAYYALESAGNQLVVDGKVTMKVAKRVGDYAFSPDGKLLALFQKDDPAPWRMTIDGIQGPGYDSISRGIKFALDGRHPVYEATRGGRTYLSVGNVEMELPGPRLKDTEIVLDRKGRISIIVVDDALDVWRCYVSVTQ